MADETKEGRALSGKNAEALTEALGTIKRVMSGAGVELDERDIAALDAVAEKCMSDSVGPVEVTPVPAPKAYGGSQSFAEFDTFDEQRKDQYAVEDQLRMFQSLANNILTDESLTPQAKASALETLIGELPDRIENPPESKEDDGILARVKEFFTGSKEIKKVKGKFVVTSKDGKKVLGTYDTEDEAEKRLAQVEMFKKKDDEITESALEDGHIVFTQDKSTGLVRWIAAYSNNFQDKEKETFEADAHKEFVEWADETGNYPDLWLWHTPGTKFGQCDFLEYTNHFMLASGTIDAGKEAVARTLAKMEENGDALALSHGYKYRRGDKEVQDDGNVYKHYRTFEISILPSGRASNPFTQWDLSDSIESKEDGTVTIRPDKKEFLIKALGEEEVTRVEEFVGRLNEKALGAGVSFKDVIEAVTPEEEETPDETPSNEDGAEPTAKVASGHDEDAEDEEGAESGDESDESGDDDEVLEGLKTTLETISEGVISIAERMDTIEGQITELEKSDDDKLTARVKARGGPTTNGKGPSKKKSTEIDEEEAAKLTKGGTKEEPVASVVAPFLEQVFPGMSATESKATEGDDL